MNMPFRSFILVLLVFLVASHLVADSIRWTGSVDGNWDTTTANWTGDDTTFEKGDDVTFADDPGSDQNITIVPSSVEPRLVTFSAATHRYTHGTTNTGAIAGDCQVRIGALELTYEAYFTNNAYTGGTVIQPGGKLVVHSDGGNPFGTGTVSAAGTLRIHGTKGSLVGSGSLVLLKDGTLELFNSDTDGWGIPAYYSGSSAEGRWGDSEPIRLNSGTIQITYGNNGKGATLSSEDVGPIVADGGSRTHATPQGANGGASVLTADTIARTNRGCLATDNLSPADADVTIRRRVCIDDGASMVVSNMLPTWLCTSLRPWWISFATYDATLSPIGNGTPSTTQVGIVTAPYSGGSNLDTHDGASTDHILLHDAGGTITIDNNTRIRALRTDAGNIDIASGKTLTISSGGIIINGRNHSLGSAGSNISFENSEGIIWTMGVSGFVNLDAYNVKANLVGTDGLTLCDLALNGDIRLSGNNSSVSGPITVDYGGVKLQNANGLPNDQDLRVAGGATLDLDSQNTLTVSNLTGRGTVTDSTPTASLTVKGAVNPGDNGCGVLPLSGVNLHFDSGSSMIVDAHGKMGYAGVDFDKIVSSGQVTGIANAELIVNPPETITPRAMKDTKYLVIQCTNDLTGVEFKRITYPSPWKVYCEGTTNGMLVTFSTIQGSVITVF